MARTRHVKERARLRSFRILMRRQQSLLEEMDMIRGNDHEREKEISEKMEEALTEMNMIRKDIEALDEPYRTILYDHYILDHSLGRIASEMHYEYKYLSRLHTEGIGILKKTRNRNTNNHEN